MQSPIFQTVAVASGATPPTPPGGVIYIFVNAAGAFKQINDQGVVSAFGGGGGGTITTAAPLSGDGSVGTPATIAAGAIALTKLATQADQTVAGNGSGGAESPVALVISGATGLIADGTTLKNTVVIGLAGGQTLIGGALTAQNLIARPNGADTTTGQVIIGTGTAATSAVWDQPTKSLNFGGVTPSSSVFLSYAASVNGLSGMRLQNTSAGGSADHRLTIANDIGISLILATDNSIGAGLGSITVGANGAWIGSQRGLIVTSGNTSPFILSTHDGTLEIFRAVESGGNRTMTFHASTFLGFFGATPVAQQTVSAVTYTIVDYATDAATIKSTLAQHATALRNLGLGA